MNPENAVAAAQTGWRWIVAKSWHYCLVIFALGVLVGAVVF
jgi:hypothetical protein